MKKLLPVILIVVVLVSILIPQNVYAATAIPLDVPKASGAPTLDGVVDTAGEWKDAWHSVLDTKSPGWDRTDNAISGYDTLYDFYMMWDANGLYIAASCKGDKTPAPKMTSGKDTQDNTKRGDGFQILINPTGKTPGKNDYLYYFGDVYCEYAADVTPFFWEYTILGGDTAENMPKLDMKIGTKRDGENWGIEMFYPWSDMKVTLDGANDQFKFDNPKAGYQFAADFHILDMDGTGDFRRMGLTPEAGWDLQLYNLYKLVDTSAGNSAVAPVAETTVATTPETQAVVETAPAVPEAEVIATPTSTASNPQTSDYTTIIFFTLFVSSMYVVAFIKKSKVK